MNKSNMTENAVLGTTTATSIAANPTGANKRKSLLSFMIGFRKKLANQLNFRNVKPFPISIDESFDMSDMFSRLSSIGNSAKEKKNTVTYGVEDDENNIMKVTVSADQAKEFEAKMAEELANNEDIKKQGFNGKTISMAELLFNLKNEFDIVDVQFPEIPYDAVYNADKVSYNTPDSVKNNNTDVIGDNEFGQNDSQMGGDEMGAAFGEDGMEGMGDSGEGGEMGSDELGAAFGEDGEMSDDDRVEDFGTEAPAPTDEKSILSSVLDMLKAQAEAEKAKAEAEAEKARALQAEHSARAAQATVAQQEELIRMQSEVQDQKHKEKEARKFADIARYRVNKANGIASGMVKEDMTISDEQAGTPAFLQSLNRQKAIINATYAPNANDTPEQARYKAQQKQLAINELAVKIRRAKLSLLNNRNNQQNNNQQNNNQQNNNQQQNQQNNNQQQNGM